jgi:serine/threonine protein kinase/class 3 adenylate cyclase
MTEAATADPSDERPVPSSAAVAPVPMAAPSSRLMVLMFTDVVGSVKLKPELGMAAYAKLLARHDALFRSIVESTPGAEVRQDTGDGFYAAFATPSDAVTAGLRFQLGLRSGDWDPKPLGVRVGIHLGQMEQVSPADAAGYTKLVGLGADLAARVMSLALPGQVLMTRGVFDDARLYLRAIPATTPAPDAPAANTPQWLAHGRYRLAGQDEPVDVYEAGVPGVSPLVPPPDSEKAKRFLGPDEEQTLGWRPAAGRDIPGRPGWLVDRKLGEGGFGEVWLGRNIRTRTERVYKFCFDADRLRSLKRELTLFRLLREALGDRPDIAKLHDVRLDQPPFFLESDYSPLGDLADWAQRQGGIDKVPLATRLDLIARVADAVGAAHSVGILHKDLKPQNVLMFEAEDKSPRPRLADFGIGILTDRSRLDGFQITPVGFSQTLLTQNESSRTGTRMYAPPELLAGRAFTVQGDVYALGVLLYQMVVGDLSRPLAPGWERDVEDDVIREDVAACVEGDTQRRLGSAAELAKRLRTRDERRAERERAGRAAMAVARRQAVLRMTIAATVVMAMLLSLTVYGLVRENRLKVEAIAASERLRVSKEFFDKLFSAANPHLGGNGRQTTLRQALDISAKEINSKFVLQPDLQASFRGTVGAYYRAFGESKLAEQNLRAALGYLRKAAPADIETATIAEHLAWSMEERRDPDDLDEVLALLKEVYEIYRLKYGEKDSRTIEQFNDWEMTKGNLLPTGDPDKMYASLRDATNGKLSKEQARETIETSVAEAAVLWRGGKHEEAQARIRSLGEQFRRSNAALDVYIPKAMRDVGYRQYLEKDYDAAEPLLREALAEIIELRKKRHPQTVLVRLTLGEFLREGRKSPAALAESATELEQALAVTLDAYEPTHWLAMDVAIQLANTYVCQASFEKAEQLARQTVRAATDAEAGGRKTLAQFGLARALSGLRQDAEAERLLREVYETVKATEVRKRRLDVKQVAAALAEHYARAGQAGKAAPFRAEADTPSGTAAPVAGASR